MAEKNNDPQLKEALENVALLQQQVEELSAKLAEAEAARAVVAKKANLVDYDGKTYAVQSGVYFQGKAIASAELHAHPDAIAHLVKIKSPILQII